MKARKTMKNQPLIQEVISQISQRFAPKIPDIKKVPITLRLRPLLLMPRCFSGDWHPPRERIHRTSRWHERHLCLRCV